MKVAVLVSSFPAISETFVLNQITGLIDQGADVTIYAYGKEKGGKIHKDVKKYSLISKTYYRKMPSNIIWKISKGAILLLINLRKAPVRLLKTLNFLRYGELAYSLNLLYMGIAVLNSKENPDIIHAHFGSNGLLAVALKEIGFFQAKVVTTFHGSDMSVFIQRKGKRVYLDLFKKGSLFLPISKFWKKKLISLGCPSDKTIVHHMGVDLEKFEFEERHFDENLKLISVCRLVPKKGIRYALEGLSQLKNSYPNLRFTYTLIGDGPLREELENSTEELNLKENVKFKGWLPQEQVLRFLQESDLLLAPSHKSEDGNMEGIPVAIIEAMATGLIVIATRHSGIPELIVNEKTGFLVPEKNSNMIAKKIEYLVENKEKWALYSKEARKMVEKDFNIKHLNDNLVKTFQEALETE